jgi:(E)-4-hydroxy-3-methylbut-2-enyl-diphosphate synthase
MRQRGPVLVSCPTCGRCEVNIIALAEQVEQMLQKIQKPLRVAVMGCIVNGPGEAKDADIGIACGKGKAVLFKGGEQVAVIAENEIIARLMREIEEM